MLARITSILFAATFAAALPGQSFSQSPELTPLPEVEFEVPPKVMEAAKSNVFRWQSAVQSPNPLCAANPVQRFQWFQAFYVGNGLGPTACWRLDMECRKDGSMHLAKQTTIPLSECPKWVVPSPRQ